MGLRDDASAPALPGLAPTVLVLAATERILAPDDESAWLAALPPDRGETLRRWPDARDRHRSLLGTRLLLEALQRLGFPDATLDTLRHPPKQRPTIDLPVDFSLSHTDGLVVCAVVSVDSVGIDVERVGAIDASGFARYLTPAERAHAGDDPHRFCIVWTRKEAVVKAAGSTGLAALPRIDTAADPDRVAFEGRSWHTTSLPVGDGHVAHVASDRGDAVLRFAWFKPT